MLRLKKKETWLYFAGPASDQNNTEMNILYSILSAWSGVWASDNVCQR